jgi:hypothetical protein
MDNNMEDLTYNGLPVMVADDDFIEHLREQGFDSIELDELYLEYEDWAAENVL